MEEYAYTLDFMPYGRGSVRTPMVQVIGDRAFTLLEATLVSNATSSVGERLYVGKEGREKVDKIKRRISYDELTNIGRDNLGLIITKIVSSNEAKFVNFINQSKPASIRVHSIELIPGIGKKNIRIILDERDKKPFESFKEIKERVPSWADPIKSVVERIIIELQMKEKYYFFVMPPIPPRPPRRY